MLSGSEKLNRIIGSILTIIYNRFQLILDLIRSINAFGPISFIVKIPNKIIKTKNANV
jgi:hypothetical protein